MNIQTEALLLFLERPEVEVPTQYFSEDYKQITDKAKAFHNKRGEMPSLKFLFNNVKKLSNDREQIDRLEDILYAVEKYKRELDSPLEVSELLLEDYKKDNIRNLTKKLAQAQADDNWLLAEKYSKEIGEISRLDFTRNDFLESDIKEDMSNVNTKTVMLKTGWFSDKDYSFSKCPVGSLILFLGSSGLGKTLMNLAGAVERYLAGSNEIFVSYELPKATCIARIKSYLTKVPVSEIVTENYVTEDAKVLVQASEIVMKREIDIQTAYDLLNKNPNEDFEDYPIRANYFKLIAALDVEAFKRKKAKGEALEDLPTDREILNMMTEFGDTLNYITIDLISEVNFEDRYLSEEAQLRNFGKELKANCLMFSTNCVIVSQPQSENNPFHLYYPKFSKALRTTCDMNVVLLATAEMTEGGLVALGVEKCRHSTPNSLILCSADRASMRFDTMEEEISLWELLGEIGKDFKKKGADK